MLVYQRVRDIMANHLRFFTLGHPGTHNWIMCACVVWVFSNIRYRNTGSVPIGSLPIIINIINI